MRRVVAALVVCLGLAVPACALALVVETGANVDQELVGLKTTDGLRIKDADCRPQGKSFSIIDSKLASPLWTCYVSDGLRRVYNVTAHVRNASAPGDIGSLDRVTVLNCWDDFSKFRCGHRPKIVATPAAAASNPPVEQETGGLVQRQLLALKLTDGIRIKQADCVPITWHWSVGSGNQIFGYLWGCYVSDSLSRVYSVRVHVLNSARVIGVDDVTVLSCWDKFARFDCTRGAKIVLPDKVKKASAVVQCLQSAKHKADLGSPVVADTQGESIRILFIDQRDNYVRDCVYAPGKNSFIDSGKLSNFPAPAPDAITYQAALCIQDGKHTSVETFGRVGSNIARATFKFSDAKPVQGTVLRGFYEAWWLRRGSPDQIVLTANSGKVVTVQVPRSSASGACLNLTGLASMRHQRIEA